MKRGQSGYIGVLVLLVAFMAFFRPSGGYGAGLTVAGEIVSSAGGFRFPDGSLQQKAVNAPFVVVPDDIGDVGDAVAGLGAGGTVFVRALGTCYSLDDTVHINNSGVSLVGEPGACLRLNDHINKPVVAIGSQEEEPTTVVEDITVQGLEIDGNKANQDSELVGDMPWIRNNGIDIRAARRVVIDNVVAHDARSGGIVVSWGSSDIHVQNSSFTDNFFDGVAYYDSERVYTSNSSMRNNQAAGISLDNDFREAIFANCILDGNQDVGIFMRFSQGIRFNGCAIRSSGSYAAFLSHDEAGNGVQDIVFSGCHLLQNNGGIRLASTEDRSKHNVVVGSVFRGNEQNGRLSIDDSDGAILQRSANIVIP
jgi:hypothetical protein